MTETADDLPIVWSDGHEGDPSAWRHDGLTAALVRYLPTQRWFGDKGRAIIQVDIVASAAFSLEGTLFLLTIVELRFADADGSSRYLMPLGLVDAVPLGRIPLGRVTGPTAPRFLIDALDDERLPSWFLDQLANERVLDARVGSFSWRRHPEWDALLEEARRQPVVIGGAEQSNSSMRYGSALFVKIYRRLRSGENPDEEIGRYLSRETTFQRLPRLVGSVAYVDRAGTSSTVALVQEYVSSAGDGWTFALERLAALASAGSSLNVAAQDPVDVRLLGQRTGELHQALAQPTADAAFAAIPIAPRDAAAWQSATRRALRAIEGELKRRQPDMSPQLQARISTFLRQHEKLEDQARGFERQIGHVKSRVHGDYHLGQTLRTPDDDWIIIDFEGEPARTIDERRTKVSPLKDVAGMLRSLSYARGAALRAITDEADRAAAAPVLASWEAASRTAFLSGYRDQVRSSSASIIADDDDAFQTAVAAWELDKAIYEIGYELNNRPDWLDLPLDALIVPD